MSRSNIKYVFIKFTSSWATNNPNGLDWIRTVYFSLFTGVLFLLVQRLSTLSILSIFLFFICMSLLIIGGLTSGAIATRFKKHEKEHDKQAQDEMVKKTSDIYFYEKETQLKSSRQLMKTRLQHFSFYFVGLIALGLLVHIFFKEQKRTDDFKILIKKRENLTQQANSLIQIINITEKENKNLENSLHTTLEKLLQQEKHIIL